MSTKMQQQVACNATKESVTFFATLSNKNTQQKELGSWIKQHREKANLSQESAAEKAGLSRFQWIRIENGQSGTKRDTLIQIAKAINADASQTLRKGGFVDSSIEYESNDEENIETTELSENVRVQLLGAKNFSEEDKREFMDAFQVAYEIAQRRIAEKRNRQ